MKILFIGSRLLDDVSWYTKKLGIETIVTESNNNADNLELADKKYKLDININIPLLLDHIIYEITKEAC